MANEEQIAVLNRDPKITKRSQVSRRQGDINALHDALTAFEKMNLIESEWWLDAATRAEGLLHFSVEFA